MSQALSLARRDQDVEYEIEERARLCGARYDPPVEGETLQVSPCENLLVNEHLNE